MTLFFPDFYSGQDNISLAGTQIVLEKATQGTGYTSPFFSSMRQQAASRGVFFIAYHFLEAGNAAAQAAHAHAVVGNSTPLMVDFEPTTGSNPQMADIVGFTDHYGSLGGKAALAYYPHWYWAQIGAPSLQPLVDRKLHLVSSAYTSYSSGGPGWGSYGGMSPAIWQFSDAFPFNGQRVDFNAFKGTLDEFRAMISGGSAPGPAPNPEPVLHSGDSGSAVVHLQSRLNTWGASLTIDGSLGPATLSAVRSFQGSHGLTVDGVVGSATWSALDKTPPTAPSGPQRHVITGTTGISLWRFAKNRNTTEDHIVAVSQDNLSPEHCVLLQDYLALEKSMADQSITRPPMPNNLIVYTES